MSLAFLDGQVLEHRLEVSVLLADPEQHGDDRQMTLRIVVHEMCDQGHGRCSP